MDKWMDKWMDNFAHPPGADQGFAEELARAVTVGLINRCSPSIVPAAPRWSLESVWLV